MGETVGQGVTILLGNGDGTFQPASPSFYPLTGTVQAIAAGDFDGDGNPDLAVAVYGVDDAHSGVYVLWGDGRGSFPGRPPSTPWGATRSGWWRSTSTATEGLTWPSPTS